MHGSITACGAALRVGSVTTLGLEVGVPPLRFVGDNGARLASLVAGVVALSQLASA